MNTLDEAWHQALEDDKLHEYVSIASILSNDTLAAMDAELNGWSGPAVNTMKDAIRQIQDKRRKKKP